MSKFLHADDNDDNDANTWIFSESSSKCIGNGTYQFAEVSVNVTFHVTIFKLMTSLNLNIIKSNVKQ